MAERPESPGARYAPPVPRPIAHAPYRPLAIATSLLIASLAHAHEDTTTGGLNGRLDLSRLGAPAEPATDTPPADHPGPRLPLLPPPADPARVAAGPSFGEVGYRHITIYSGTGIGFETDAATDQQIAASVGVFIAPDLEVNGELGLWYFGQDGDDAVGVSTSFVFKWHFIHRENWTVHFNAGVGPMLATDSVPAGGTNFNFMPRLGLGFTREISDSGTRLYGGARWHHISNARIAGETRNPDRDGMLFEIGLAFPF